MRSVLANSWFLETTRLDAASITTTSPMLFYDAHNHLQDERFGGRQEDLIAESQRAGVARMVVNGSCEEDWPHVAELARRHPGFVIPSFGCHPWFVHQRTSDWQANLLRYLDETPGAVIGEIGLDRWKEGLHLPEQEEVYLWQLRLAAERNLPASLHCLQAWGRLLELLRSGPRPRCGFLLHSYGGARELIAPLAALGARFSFPGYYAQERKARQRETFRHIPLDRLLIETDAPDQSLPDTLNALPLSTATGAPLNHPANLGAIYCFAVEWLGVPLETLSAQVEENFHRLFRSPSVPGSAGNEAGRI